MNTYLEPARELKIIGEFDVVVAGGGPAGCAAAVAAARHGAKTLLIEKYGYLGGATVTQLVMPVLSSNGADLEGIWHEWMTALDAMGGVGELAARRGRKVDGSVDPELVKFAWDQLLTAAGAKILHHACVAEVMKVKGRVTGVVLETVAGRVAVAAKRVIDCTGDGLVAAMAGAGFDAGDEAGNPAMAMTKPFRLGNAFMPKDFPNDDYLRKIDEDFDAAMANGEFDDPIITSGRIKLYLKAWTRPLAKRPEMLVGGPSRILGVDPLDPWQFSEAERTARAQIRQVRDYYLKYCPGCENAYFLDSSNQIGVRSSRRIHGIDRIDKVAVDALRKREDGIARGSWWVDIWPAASYTAAAEVNSKEWAERVRNGDYYDIPYGCVVADQVDNLLVAGRCVSADHWAQSSLRIQQTCQSTGQAAGTIAALSLRENLTPRELDSRLATEALKLDRKNVKRFL